MKHFLRTPYWQLKLPTAINGLNKKSSLSFHTQFHQLVFCQEKPASKQMISTFFFTPPLCGPSKNLAVAHQ